MPRLDGFGLSAAEGPNGRYGPRDQAPHAECQGQAHSGRADDRSRAVCNGFASNTARIERLSNLREGLAPAPRISSMTCGDLSGGSFALTLIGRDSPLASAPDLRIAQLDAPRLCRRESRLGAACDKCVLLFGKSGLTLRLSSRRPDTTAILRTLAAPGGGFEWSQSSLRDVLPAPRSMPAKGGEGYFALAAQ
jgi:hypothetical protein